MKLDNLTNYVEELGGNLTKIEPTFETDEFGGFLLTKVKETFVYGSEDEADAKIDDVRQDPNFVGAEKKFKAGKMNKAGEVVRNETWTVVVKFNG